MNHCRHVPGLRSPPCSAACHWPADPPADRLLDIPDRHPDRLVDHRRRQVTLLGTSRCWVLDGSRRMLDAGLHRRHPLRRWPHTADTPDRDGATFATGRLAQELLKEPQRHRGRLHREAHTSIRQRLHWADNPTTRDRLLEAILAEPTLDRRGLHFHPARCRLAGRAPGRDRHAIGPAARRCRKASVATACCARCAGASCACWWRPMCRTRHRRAHHHPRHQLRPADEG